MRQFSYTIQDKVGIHARPANLLVREARRFQSKVILCRGEKRAEVTNLLAVLGLYARCNDTIEVEVSGEDEDAACEAVRGVFETYL